MLNPGGRLVAFAGLLFLGALTWSQCSKAAPPATQSAASATKPAAPTLRGGEMTPVVSVKEVKEQDAMVDASGTVANACSACHDVYREKRGGPQDRCLP
jgi:cytochrome c553